MSKRFTDTEKWTDPWFRRLPPKFKSLWEYLRDNCDQAGFWKVDVDYAIFHIGESFTPQEALSALNEGKNRILSHGLHWQIVEFIPFQFGRLSEDCKPHRPILGLIEKYQNKGYGKGINTLKEMEKDKEVRGGSRGGCGKFEKPTLLELKTAFREKGFAESEADKFLAYFDSVGWVVGASRKPMKNWRGAVATWCGKLKESGVRPKSAPKRDSHCTACDPKGFLPDGKKCWCWK